MNPSRFVLVAALVLAATPIAALAQSFASEDRDWGAPVQAEFRRSPYHGATPREVPGAKTILTVDLKRLMDSGARPVLIDVLSGDHPQTLPGAAWMPDGGHGTDVRDALQEKFVAQLAELAGSDLERPVVLFCLSAECWLSYNASLRAVAAGYRQVYWYRGGIAAWRQAALPLGRLPAPSR
jgi:PQQ-dependent catabolism-associated CXXCW motif protein